MLTKRSNMDRTGPRIYENGAVHLNINFETPGYIKIYRSPQIYFKNLYIQQISVRCSFFCVDFDAYGDAHILFVYIAWGLRYSTGQVIPK